MISFTVIATIVASFAIPNALCEDVPRLVMQPLTDFAGPSHETVVAWTDPESDDPLAASMYVSANVPTVNLDNIASLVSVSCPDPTNAVQISLTSIDSVAEWENTPTLLVIASRHLCAGQREIQFQLATSWRVDANAKTVTFQTTDPEAYGVDVDYELNAHPHNEDAVQKRYDKKLIQVPLKIDQSLTVGFNLAAPNGMALQGKCAPCEFKTDSTLELRATGKLFKGLPKFQIEWKGSVGVDTKFETHVDLSAKFGGPHSFEKNLFNTTLKQFKIPGLIHVDPSLFVDVSLKNLQLEKSDVEFSFAASYEDFTARINSGKVDLTGANPKVAGTVGSEAQISGVLDIDFVPKLKFGVSWLRQRSPTLHQFTLDSKLVAKFDVSAQEKLRKVDAKACFEIDNANRFIYSKNNEPPSTPPPTAADASKLFGKCLALPSKPNA